MARSDSDRPIGASAMASPPAKPKGGARLLSFLLQALVMAVALTLFFLFAGVAALFLLHLCVAGRALRRRRHRFRRPPCAPSFSGGLSPEDLRGLPCFSYPSSSGGSRAPAWPPDCAVCLESFREGDRCRALPGCGHGFHAPCVDRWLARSPACPICRAAVGAAVVADQAIGRSVGLV